MSKNNNKKQSVEPNIADLANGWLKSYRLDYKLEQESLNFEIDKAQEDYITLPVKNGKIDYDSMSTIISAIQKQKLVIKDLVLYTDKKIKATRSVINKKSDY